MAAANAVIATVLAVVVTAVSRLVRRPALVHALWLLVLFKLVTPPVLGFSVPLSVVRSRPLAAARTATVFQFPAETSVSDKPLLPRTRMTSLPDRSRRALANATRPVLAEGDRGSTGSSEPAPTWVPIVFVAWAGGFLVFVALTGWRVACFTRALQCSARASPELQQQAAELGRRLGLTRCPTVWLLPGPCSPMLWTLATRARLLLPGELWERLDAEQQAAVLVHELAHYRRRDHWLRAFELLVTALYWWHPVLWWARSRLRDAEEQCCDAWVVWALPHAARAYATAIVETIEFLSRSTAVRAPAASAIGPMRPLKRRLTMIMRGTTPRSLSWTGCLMVLALAAGTLPWLPQAQSKPLQTIREDATSLPAAPVDRPTADPFSTGIQAETCLKCHTAVPPPFTGMVSHAHARVVELGSKVSQAQKQVAEARARLMKAEHALTSAENELRDAMESFPAHEPTPPRSVRKFRVVPDQGSQNMEQRLDELSRQLDALRQQLRTRPGGANSGAKPPSSADDSGKQPTTP